MNKKIIFIVVAVLAVGALVAILLSGPKEEPAPEEQKAAETTPAPTASGLVQVDIKGYSFVGKTTRIDAGTKIIWKNMDAIAHTVTSDTGLFDSKALLKNQTFSYTFNTPGTYTYHCALHPDMTGEIIVR
jgi:plastocyanin